MKKILFLSLIAITAMLLITSGCSQKLAATVNGEKIYLQEVENIYSQSIPEQQAKQDAETEKQFKEQILEGLINEKLISQEAKKMKIKVSDKDVNTEIKNIKKMFKTEKEFQQALKTQNMDEKDLAENVKNNLLTEKIKAKVVGKVEITDKKAEEYYKKNQDQYKVGEQVKVSHILVEDEKKANEVKEKLDNGEDFSKLAKEYSTDSSNKDKGGDLGYITKEQVVPEFGNAAFALKKDEISKPVKTEFGYHIIKIFDTKKASTKEYKEVKDIIIAQLTEEEKSKKFNSWLDDVRKKAEIKKYI